MLHLTKRYGRWWVVLPLAAEPKTSTRDAVAAVAWCWERNGARHDEHTVVWACRNRWLYP